MIEKMDITKMKDEELNALLTAINNEQCKRKIEKEEKLFSAFREAWMAIEKIGYEIFFEDGTGGFPIHFSDIYFD